jgi:hypothetical protein
MAKNLQEAFIEFNATIKLDFSDSQPLRDKRDLLLNELQAHLGKIFFEKGIRISFTSKNQGSYSMGTGIEPLEGQDYDIDIMLLFNVATHEYTAKEIKNIVFDGVNRHNRNVEILKPCVQVCYSLNGLPLYHIDLAVYSNKGDKTFLSKKPKYKTDDEVWELSEPEKLKSIIDNYGESKEAQDQFKRVIRYLKRWKDLNFRSTKFGKPTGISITAIALDGFIALVELDDPIAKTYKVDDLMATLQLVEYFINQFDSFSHEIVVNLPVEPYNDLFSKMTPTQKKTLKEKLENLKEKLIQAQSEVDPNLASLILKKAQVFGDDFPEIPKNDSSEKRLRAIISSPDQA